MKRGFTLLELIIVIVIIGIIATVASVQYSKIIENSRLAEAMARLGYIRERAAMHYLEQGSLANFTGDLLDENETSCSPANGYYYYWVDVVSDEYVGLGAHRCTSGGKSPDAARGYILWMKYYPRGEVTWNCYYEDNGSSCFGYPPTPFD